ncbi:MAG: hypothetical protein F6K63_13675 [Moorea sp. SIO1G6]|uniref:hypothetical protein n=1 Tax=Moorena sp. SIO1G6 TaxID=2607840 RepID=UPI0013BFE58A|nr:hypothetical protein [Moorena sp. SIO1G6]NET65370.1 hypothetical protein [Moorena sp. SIO1G6]
MVESPSNLERASCPLLLLQFYSTPDSRFPFPSWEGLGVGSDSRFPIPDSRFPTPDSRFPIPDSPLPTPDSP